MDLGRLMAKHTKVRYMAHCAVFLILLSPCVGLILWLRPTPYVHRPGGPYAEIIYRVFYRNIDKRIDTDLAGWAKVEGYRLRAQGLRLILEPAGNSALAVLVPVRDGKPTLSVEDVNKLMVPHPSIAFHVVPDVDKLIKEGPFSAGDRQRYIDALEDDRKRKDEDRYGWLPLRHRGIGLSGALIVDHHGRSHMLVSHDPGSCMLEAGSNWVITRWFPTSDRRLRLKLELGLNDRGEVLLGALQRKHVGHGIGLVCGSGIYAISPIIGVDSTVKFPESHLRGVDWERIIAAMNSASQAIGIKLPPVSVKGYDESGLGTRGVPGRI